MAGSHFRTCIPCSVAASHHQPDVPTPARGRRSTAFTPTSSYTYDIRFLKSTSSTAPFLLVHCRSSRRHCLDAVRPFASTDISLLSLPKRQTPHTANQHVQQLPPRRPLCIHLSWQITIPILLLPPRTGIHRRLWREPSVPFPTTGSRSTARSRTSTGSARAPWAVLPLFTRAWILRLETKFGYIPPTGFKRVRPPSVGTLERKASTGKSRRCAYCAPTPVIFVYISATL
jgi:hypothetical protein